MCAMRNTRTHRIEYVWNSTRAPQTVFFFDRKQSICLDLESIAVHTHGMNQLRICNEREKKNELHLVHFLSWSELELQRSKMKWMLHLHILCWKKIKLYDPGQISKMAVHSLWCLLKLRLRHCDALYVIWLSDATKWKSKRHFLRQSEKNGNYRFSRLSMCTVQCALHSVPAFHIYHMPRPTNLSTYITSMFFFSPFDKSFVLYT